ncbi:MAG: hypothetical protein AAB595_00320 [Patescibacteria group bacterium]
MKTIIIDLKNLRNENDIVFRFYEAIGCYYYYNNKETMEEVVKKNNPPYVVWQAFEDNISGIDMKDENGKEVEDLLFIVTNTLDVQRSCSEETLNNLLVTLSYLTDPTHRADKRNFFFQIRLKDYDPAKEELNTKLHMSLKNKDKGVNRA